MPGPINLADAAGCQRGVVLAWKPGALASFALFDLADAAGYQGESCLRGSLTCERVLRLLALPIL